MSATNTKLDRLTSPTEHRNDIDAYIDSLSDERRAGLALAEVAFDLATLVNSTLAGEGDDVSDATMLAELTRQAESHFGQHGIFALVGSLQRYLHELNYRLEFSLVDLDTGESFPALTPPSNLVE